MLFSAVLQLGLCCFSYSQSDDQEKNQLIAEPYNIYVTKRPFRKKFGDDRFIFQAASVDFLANAGFDFNKCFHSKWVHFVS